MTDFFDRKCAICVGEPSLLSHAQADAYLKHIPEWTRDEQIISRTYTFKNYYQTMAFVNAVAWVAHREDHHPDLHIGYKTCTVAYTTHSAGGLSENDFICACKIDALNKG